jgi:hypothetical protein
MKTSNLFRLLAIVGILTTTIWACQKTEVESTSTDNETFKSSGAKIAACSLYSLVLNGSSGTPVIPSLNSFIFKVDPCSGATGLVSQIKIGGVTPVTSVTGLSNVLGMPGYAFAVTGKNSNFPQRLLKVQIATGIAIVVTPTQVPLQDIEHNGTNYFAILEGTARIMKVNVVSGATVFFAAPPTQQLNGMTFKGTSMYVISGNTSAICPPNSGDIWAYNSLTAAPLPPAGSYKNLPANANWTMKELGFHLDFCCQKSFMVGSAAPVAVISNRNSLSCLGATPIFLNNTEPTYDFMIE